MRVPVSEARGVCPWPVGLLRVDVGREPGREGMTVTITEDPSEADERGSVQRASLEVEPAELPGGTRAAIGQAEGIGRVLADAARSLSELLGRAVNGDQAAKIELSTLDRVVYASLSGHTVRIVAPGMVRVSLSESGGDGRAYVTLPDMASGSAMELADALVSAAAAAARVRRWHIEQRAGVQRWREPESTGQRRGK